ncbi:MAG: hypothetical protein ACRDSF_23865, partial [Pseudonocardiaceae bacterium]
EYDRLSDPSERGAVLRRERLYHSHVQSWREARDQGMLTALSARPVGRPSRSKADVDNERLCKENERLAGELAKTKAALNIVGKHTRSWSCSPKARIRTGTRPGDRGGFG